MAPKALTDCPENLREAIDWLVQVQHCGGVSTVSDALSALFDNVAQDAEKSLPSLPDPDRPSARDVVSKLRAFQSTLPKDPENRNKNIIHNLCTSAGSLLGYRYPGTYDGSGIVYGNASRLCDAILAFLYAVFSDVHSNQPYVAGSDVLHDDVIVELKSQLWRGQKGFCQVIPRVATGLQRYNAAVKASNEKVKKPIETVLDYVKPDGELRRGIQALQVGDVTGHPDVEDPKVSTAVSLVERCKEVARVFSKSLTATKDAIDDLNPKLKRKLDNARRSFFNHVDWLSKWSKKGQKKLLDKMIQKIKSRLKQLANAVKDKIKREVHTVVELLKKRVREIRMKLEGITASLEEYVKELGTWMDDAKEYIDKVKEYANKIMQQLDGEHRKAIDKAAADIDSQLGKKVGELREWIEKAEAAVTVAKEKADDVFKRLDKSDPEKGISKGLKKIEAAKEAVSRVDGELQIVHKDLDTWKNAAEDVLSNATGKADEVSRQLDPDQKGEGNPIGKNLENIETAQKAISSTNLELKTQVEKLQEWISDADRIREQAQKKAEDVYRSLDVHKELSNKIGEIKAANEEIRQVNTGLSNVDSALANWKQEAGKVIQDVVQKAKEVHKKLDDKDGQQLISQGIEQITAAKDVISKVDNGLKSVNDDFEKWRKAAEIVLTTAIEKTAQVHTALDPNESSSTLGSEIHKIDTARQGLVSANEQLKNQVDNLSKWIQDAEDIRQKAEEKAKEAYDKLSVHEKLSDNVKKILNANKAINGVHSEVERKLKQLERWNEEAKEVLQGAITNAQDVHGKLKDHVGLKVEEINKGNEAIKEADAKLAAEVGNLSNWGKAAKDIIDKAKDKCDEILKRVDINHEDHKEEKTGPVILQEASKLKEQAKKLLQAAKDAKQKVEENVKSALDAVKEMDADLKRDLKHVKDKIKAGITKVIEDLQVGKLGDKVKEDLQKLRGKIEGLKTQVDDTDGRNLVKRQLAELDKAKTATLDEIQQKIKDAASAMDAKFKSNVKDPLDREAQKVYDNITELYGKMNPRGSASPDEKKTLEKIFDSIRKEVEKIKGDGGRKEGIDGIVANVRGLYDAFVDSNNSGVDDRVDGWLGSILGINKNQRKTQTDGMKAVTSWINVYRQASKEHENALKAVKEQIKEALGNQIRTGQGMIRREDVKDNIVQNLTKVKDACKVFADELDKKLMKGQIESFADPIAGSIQGVSHPAPRETKPHREYAIRAALVALCSCVRQIAIEIESLAINKFGRILDTIKPTVDDLHGKLGNATNAVTPGEANPVTGTAQAVDKAIEGVKDMVGSTIEQKFQQDVKQPVEDAVQGLDAAVKDYDEKAREQVKDAAKGAIDKAANVISDNGGSDIDLGSKMPNFHKAHKDITNKLRPQLEQLLNDHIGRDEIPFVGKAEKVKLSKDFQKYFKHITTGVLTNHPHGPLAEAIDKIGGEGMKGLSKHIGKYADERIRDNTFIHPIYEIGQQLEEITDLVNNEGKGFMGEGYTPTSKGVKTLLTDLTKALGDGKLDGINTGLAEIQKVIEKLQKDTFGLKAEAISKAVDEIKLKLNELREKLKSEHDNDDVINALKELKDSGLASGKWNGKSGSPVNGLKIIEEELRKNNEELPKQSKTIRDAINNINRELRGLGFKLHHDYAYDDITDQLRKLENHIGTGMNNYRNNLQEIKKEIRAMWAKQFSKHPHDIKIAAGVIRGNIGVLHHVLDNDVINPLMDLRDAGLGAGKWDKGIYKKGHALIEKKLKDQQESLSQQHPVIQKAMETITAELESLRTALQSRNGNPKDDVINSLEDFLSFGLNGINWRQGKPGLGQIKQNLQGQNAKLSHASDRIELATNRVLRETEDMLRKVQNKLGPELVPYDTITSYLRQLKEKIGKENGNGEGLQGIQREISRMQGDAFKSNPEKIEKAKKVIRQELEKLKGNLQNEVTKPLNDLVEQGFGSSDQWNGHDAKGFDHIKNNLKNQHTTLSPQPEKIDSGMKEITDELLSLRTELHGTGDDNPQGRGVIKNLEFMKNRIGNNDDEGLKKIKSDMEFLKNDQGKGITDSLDKMSLAIQDAAAYADWHANQMATKHIDGKLKGIQDNLNNLRLTDLADAIKLCDDFLQKADEIERNTIDALWKHVDHEVDDAIRDLTKQARQHYVDSVREALELFAKKVNEDLEQLPNEVNRDRYVGYKGFMRYLHGPLTSDLTGDEHSVAELSYAFQEVFGQIEKYVKGEITRLHDEQNKEKNPLLPPTEDPYTPKLNHVYKALIELLVYLRDNDGGDYRLTELVERLTKALRNLVPSDFKHPSTPLLDTVARGLSKFAGEFHNTYISAYSGQRCKEEDSHKYAKVLLSMIPMTHKALSKFMKKCAGEWKDLHISKFTADDRDNALGNYLTRCGYRVSSAESGQDGELNNMFTGAGIYELLVSPIRDVSIELMIDGDAVTHDINFVHIISLLYNTLCQYFQACHIYAPPNPRYPCTVRDMLSWLSGLRYTQVADKLPEHCKALLNRKCHDGDTPNKDDPIMVKCIDSLPLTIATTCSYSTALLTAIQGNGHGFDLSAYPYSVDFSNNRARLHYPADPDALLDMLREIVCRLCKVLYFLYSQCCRSTARVKGWRECAYGRQVPSHNWQCQQIGTYSSTISTTTATITSSTTIHGCPPTSPLQSFLSDSCHGLLPHTLTASDMKIECTNCTGNQPGQQCLTPLGFWDLGFAASISGTGWALAKRLGNMCRDADACLFVLCRTLLYLCPTAPSSLADVFALYAQVLRQWDTHDRVEHRGGTYTDASDFISHLNIDGIDSLFPLWTQLHGSYENHQLTTAIASLTDHDHESHNGLSTLFNDSTCKSPSGCAPYLQPLGLHAYHTYPRKHAGLYITWIMHLAWQFWELLCGLLQALDNINCTASGCATCPCQPGIHGDKDTCHCPSLVHCAAPLPTLYRYGFTYRNANLLVTGNRVMRCGDLNTQLKEALHSGHFTELFRQIDQLIWHIRMPFLYFLIALWSFVALYILHTFLYRMDVLHIRSHLLSSKASHLIDVKALLIPSRKMLSLYDASYFDDDPSELLDAT